MRCARQWQWPCMKPLCLPCSPDRASNPACILHHEEGGVCGLRRKQAGKRARVTHLRVWCVVDGDREREVDGWLLVGPYTAYVENHACVVGRTCVPSQYTHSHTHTHTQLRSLFSVRPLHSCSHPPLPPTHARHTRTTQRKDAPDSGDAVCDHQQEDGGHRRQENRHRQG